MDALIDANVIESITAAKDMQTLDVIRIEYLGKKGKLTEILKTLANLSGEERIKVGQEINLAKQDFISRIEERRQQLRDELLQQKLAAGQLDVTLPGRQNYAGAIHPITQVRRRINEYFSKIGFDLISGLEVETEFYNFEALNIPSHHPARAMHDTFYFGDGHLLRTHTSPMQIRVMEKHSPPLRLIAPGRVYRCDSDLTHTPMFHQIEGLYIDKQVTLSGLKGILSDFFAYFFNRELAIRFRPSYFPFTEPSAEVDLECTQCQGKGCRACKYTGWLEVLGCGMVHPNVLKAVQISPDEYQGWAFGMGIDRLAMLYFGISDLRMMFENDVMFLKQFSTNGMVYAGVQHED